MWDGVIILAEVGLAILFGLLALRMSSLARSEWIAPLPAHGPARAPHSSASVKVDQADGPQFGVRLSDSHVVTAPDRTELITQLHILMALQDKVCREDGLLLESSPDVVKNYAVAWSYGAASGLVGVSNRHSAEVVSLTARLVAKKIGYRQSDAVQAIETLTESSSMLACYRHGLESADHWLQHHHVPAENALNRSITSNTFI
ncbi:MAG: hypothetical protein R3276_05585 [Marinobacter sp.]|nr:hypothetical protein [Marinobacter sp.]